MTASAPLRLPSRTRPGLLFASVLLASLLPLTAQRGPQAPAPVTATPFHPSSIYNLGDKAGWTITPTPGITVPAGDFSYTVKTNNSATVKTGTFSLATGNAAIEFTASEPTMLYVQVSPPPGAAPGGGGARGIGAAPSAPSLPLPTLDALKSGLSLTETQASTIAPLLDAVAQAQTAVNSAQAAYLQLRSGLGDRLNPMLTEPQRPQLAQVLNPPTPARGGGTRGGGAGGLTLGAAGAPTKLQPAAPRPADFDAFWDGKLAELAKIPINPVLTPGQANKAGVELSTVQLDSVGSHVQGYLAKPAREGKFPAIILYQYAGVYNLQPNSVTDRAAEGWLALDVDSHDIPPNEGQQQHPELNNYQSIGNTDRETSYFLKMYLRDARAVDYIMSRPDWDGKTIVFMGTSMGGQQSLVTAGLRPNITALLVNEPSGADFNGDLHGRKTGYPNWLTNNPNNAKAGETGAYFDTVNFASRIKAKALIAMGFIDTTAPPVGIWTAFDQIPGAKEAVPMIESDHNNITPQKQGAWDARSKEVRDLLLKGGAFVPNPATARP